MGKFEIPPRKPKPKTGGGKTISDKDQRAINRIKREFGLNDDEAQEFLESLKSASEAEEGDSVIREGAKFFRSGGSVKGRPAKRSAENS